MDFRKCKKNLKGECVMNKIFEAIKTSSKLIANELKYADFGPAGSKNSTGDNQLKLDIISDNIITSEFKKLNIIKSLISEEKGEEYLIDGDASYIVAYDPLDGSSLVDVNFAIGSIFGIYEDSVKSENLKAAAYVIYGPRIELVICEKTPKLYRLDKDGEFKFVQDIVLETEGKINATGASQKSWSDTHRKFINSLFENGYRLRYSGAMVSDLHQILLKGGGLFSYPSTDEYPNGKLRVVFEVLPFAYIFEKAGGLTTDGNLKSLLDIKIQKIHQTTPCFFGSKNEIKALRKAYDSKK